MKKILGNYIIYEIIVIVCLFLNIAHTHQRIMNFSQIHHVIYPINHICFFIFEVFSVFALSYIIPKYKKNCLLLLYVLTTIVLWINIGYSRYFDTYLPLSLYGEYNNLDGLLPNILDAIENDDLFFLITSIFVIFAYLISNKKNSFRYNHIPLFFLFIAFSVSLLYYTYWISEIKKFSSEHYKELGDQRTIWDFMVDHWHTLNNNNHTSAYHYYGIGLNLFFNGTVKLFKSNQFRFTEEEESIIKSHIVTTKYNFSTDSPQNIIFIIVESLCSYPINKTFEGIEITPNINKTLSSAYYNPKMKCETKLGESSDGQFIYMAGLLPLNNSVTINEISKDTITTFISLAKEKILHMHSKMVIPTKEYTWSQSSMCKKYGVDSLYSRDSYTQECFEDWLNDKQVFELAEKTDINVQPPFINFILTLSMHSPYIESIETYGIEYPSDFSQELKHYLDNVHYTDKYLGQYLESIKKYDWYNNCTIIIVADHKPNGPKLNYNKLNLFTDLPLIIINPPCGFKNKVDNRVISQTSLFPTLLDILQIDSKWRGVDQSIFMPDSIRNTDYELERIQHKENISNYVLNNYLQ